MKLPSVLLAAVSVAFAGTPALVSAADSPSLDSAPLVASAEQLVDALAREEFSVAVEQFDATMQRALPAPKLETVWRNLTQQVGPFEERVGVRTARQAGYDVVFVACEFRDFLLEAKVVFNAEGEVAGLFFAPPPKDS